MTTLLEHADAVWQGLAGRDATGIGLGQAGRRSTEFEQVAHNTWVLAMTVVVETGDGLLMVDPGVRPTRRQRHTAIRRFTDKPLNTAIYSHGQADHIWGVDIFCRGSRTARLATT